MKKALAIVAILAIGAGALFLLFRTPQAERVWTTEFSRTSRAEVGQDGRVTLRNVRDWTYEKGRAVTEAWQDTVVLDPSEVERAWFMFEPFPSLPVAGHTYLTFEFENGSAYSFSVEARREDGEPYSALSGLFRSYELAYTWGTERDFLTRRVLYLSHEVRMHELRIEEEKAEALFVALAEETEELSRSPRFYNTLSANCTNLLAEMANDRGIATLPYDLAWNLPGFSEAYLGRIGLITPPGRVFVPESIFPDEKAAGLWSRALRSEER